MEDKSKNDLQEQKAPLKNDDDAYVQVGQNGEPVFPEPAEKQSGKEDKEGNPTTLDKR